MKSRTILILALITAIMTTFLFNNYLKKLDQKYKKIENKISIIVPKKAIKKNTQITKEMLELKEFDKDSVHPEAIKKTEQIEGKYALTDMKKDEILFLNRFKNQFEENTLVTRKITPNNRAVSVEVNFIESVSNLIEPEDYVDIIFTEDNKETSLKTTKILLKNIRVLAVGKRLVPNTKQPKDPNEKNLQKEVEYVSVTLELNSSDSITLINADLKGAIKLILRSKLSS